MRGQHLFIRPIEASDRDPIEAFFRSEGIDRPAPACGLLGKLVGTLTAVVGMGITAEGVVVHEIVVSRELRRKRVARTMLDELERIAAKVDRRQLIVEGASEAGEFLHRVGFEREGSRWIRKVRESQLQSGNSRQR